MLGKWLSNTTVLAALVLGMIIAAGILQLVRGEDPRIDLWALSAPFLIILFPALTVVAALAVLFECINALRGFCREFGLTVTVGARTGVEAMARAPTDPESAIPLLYRSA